MNDNVSKIKDRLGVVDVVSGYLKVQKAGVNFKAPCPFHNEKTPSFFISPERQIWHCFGCQKGGDVFTFIQEIEGVEFPEALRILAVKAGIELEEFDSDVKNSKDRLYQICEMSARFFEKQLTYSNTGKFVLEYLRNRGLENNTIAKFRLGFAPDTWDSLSTFLSTAGYTEKEITDAGVAIKRDQSPTGQKSSAGIYDRFRSRITFPIADVNGRVVGFTGRVFETRSSTHSAIAQGSGLRAESVAKYINTPQTLIYDKSRVLYCLDHSRGEIRKKDKCLLVEGNMDAIMSYQSGVTNVVASSGTALTPTHLSLLKRFTNNLDFCFDTDSAGAVATRRGVGIALSQGFNTKVVSIDDKECKDPADYVKKYGSGWEKIVSSAKSVVEFYLDKSKEIYDPNSAESKKNVILAVAPFIKRLSSRVEKDHWINQIALFLKVKESAVEGDILSAPDDLNAYDSLTEIKSKGTNSKPLLASKIEAPDVLNETLLSLIFKKPLYFKEEITSMDYQSLNPITSQVVSELKQISLEEFEFNNFIKKFNPDQLLDLEFIYLKSQALWDGFEDDELKIEFATVLKKLRHRNIQSRLTSIEYEIKAAESLKDKVKIDNLISQFNSLTQELAQIHKI